MELVSYLGWPNCYRLANREVELVVTGDVGPRLIRFGFIGEDNEFAEFSDQVGQTGGDQWRLYGGHRLWRAPEVIPRTYTPDNGPVEIRGDGNTLLAIQQVESSTGIQKEIEVRLDDDDNRVKVVREHQAGLVYPDFGASLECFTNAEMLEVETLGPLTTLEPGSTVEHVEQWHLYRDVDPGDLSDDAIDAIAAKFAEAIPVGT